jgi:tryptophan synthase alpha chain
MTPGTAVSDAYAKARAEGRAALVGYVPAGFPTVEGSIEVMRLMADAGCDVIEVGLPYSDPVMDGPVIQAAAQRALEQGIRVRDVLRVVEGVADSGVATLVMTYWNPVERYGVERWAADLASAGGAGLITPDITPEEAGPWLAASDVHGLARIFLVAPSSTDERIHYTADHCSGFVYATAVMGVTGARETTSDLARPLVARTRRATDLPVGVGLGVSNGDQAAEVASYADGVIVGSAFVRRVHEAHGPSGASGRGLTKEASAAVEELTRDLAQGVRRGGAAGEA